MARGAWRTLKEVDPPRPCLRSLDCDAICLLDGWWNSVGAKAEYAVARWLGLEVVVVRDGLTPRLPKDPDAASPGCCDVTAGGAMSETTDSTSERDRMIERAENDLAAIASLAQSTRKQAEKLARLADLVLVDRVRLARLEALAEAVGSCWETAVATRDYKDAIEAGKAKYNGKRWLLGRSEFDAVLYAYGEINPTAPRASKGGEE